MSWHSLFQAPPGHRHRYRVHLIGIGGTGLAPIANVLLDMGFQVSGSDLSASTRTEWLEKLGAHVMIGHEPNHLHQEKHPSLPDVVLASSAIPATNPEVVEAQKQGVPIIRRRDFLGPLTRGRRVIAVAGTHGKTTTTAMIAHVLSEAGIDPGYIIGSQVPGLGFSAAGASPLFVIEADEYDNAFLGLRPTIAVLTSLDWDHPDCFPNRQSYELAFRKFLQNMRPEGQVLYCRDDVQLRGLAKSLGEPDHWHSYGSRNGASWKASNIDITAKTTRFTLHTPTGHQYKVRLRIPGLHNVLNSIGAIMAADLAGVSINRAIKALAHFHSPGRRFEIIGECRDILIIDDYGHHPVEVRTTLAAARAAYSNREIWAIYQPHTFSRTRTFMSQFEGAFSAADHVIITDIFPAREPIDPNTTAEQVVAASRHYDARAIGDFSEIVSYLSEQVGPNSLVIIFSAGTATQIGPSLLEKLESLQSH